MDDDRNCTLAMTKDVLESQISSGNSSSDKENSMDAQNINGSSIKTQMSPNMSLKSSAKEEERCNLKLNDDSHLTELLPSENETPLFVTCGPNKAILYLERLDRGSKGASVLFDNWWLTPNEFQKVSGRGTAKDWKRSIKHHGRSLKLLMSKGMLFLNPPVCKCDYCTGNASPEEQDTVSMETANNVLSSAPQLPASTGSDSFTHNGELTRKEMEQGEQSSKELPTLCPLQQNQSSENSTNSENMKDPKEKQISLKEGSSFVVEYDPKAVARVDSIEVSALSDNRSDGTLKADDSEKIGGNDGGNDPRQNDTHSYDQINNTAAKLPSLTTGNPQIEGNNDQLFGKRSNVPLSIINSTDANERSTVDSKIKTDRSSHICTSELSSSEVNEEIREEINMETQENTDKPSINSENSPAVVETDDIDSSKNCLPSGSPRESKEAEESSLTDVSQTNEELGSLGTPHSTPLALDTSSVKGESPGIITDRRLNGSDETLETGSASPPTGSCNELEEGTNLMSPKKEARLINIIEELKHYKKCLEVQIQEQKRVNQSQPTTQMKSPDQQPKSTIVHSPVTNNTSSSSSSNKSPWTKSSSSPYDHEKNNNYSHFHGSSSTYGYYNGDYDSKKVIDPSPEETIDHSSHVTGTVHWGKPKGHSPMHTNTSQNVAQRSVALSNSLLHSSLPATSVNHHNPHHHQQNFGTNFNNSNVDEKPRKRTAPIAETSVNNSSTWNSSMLNFKNHFQLNSLSPPSSKVLSNSSPNAALEIPNSLKKIKQHHHIKTELPHNNKITSPVVNNNGNMGLNYANYANMAAQFLASPTADMNAYFIYLSECFKNGEIPNIYGFYNTLAKATAAIAAKKEKLENPVALTATIETDSRKRKYVSSSSSTMDNIEESGVLDLSVKKMKKSDSSFEKSLKDTFVVDKSGALDLSMK